MSSLPDRLASEMAGQDSRNARGDDRGKSRDDHRDSGRDDDDNDDNDDRDEKDEDDEKDDDKPGLLQNPMVRIGIVIAVIILLIGGLLYWLHARQYEDTDDAFIDAHIVHVAPQISGLVNQVAVNDNQFVRKGQLLAIIDSADARSRLAQIDAQRVQAETQIAQAEATEKGAAAQADAASRDVARYNLLQRTAPNAVAQQQIDQANATARNAIAQRDAARAQIAGARAQIKVLAAQRGQIALNLGYTRILAPVDGHIAQRAVAAGNYVQPGQELMTIVPLDLWVTANFKETQLALMRVGQGVDVVVDACDKPVHGHVQSIQRGAGQAFGVLPPENATGNYVKVVQRVPVKIVLDRLPKDCILGPGMSVEPTVKVR
ncbi:MAG TPA: HlyD family secretion protein [Rhizomicrobium sp.]|jgi:membrane fusion protein (multidrug efflux system)|nr:HlyD family secretion protein [Rhizomicrobium sp.]